MPGPLALVGLPALATFFRRVGVAFFSKILKDGFYRFFTRLGYMSAIAAAFLAFQSAATAALNSVPLLLPPHFENAVAHFIHPQMPTLISAMITFHAGEWLFNVAVNLSKLKFRG